MTGKPIKTHLRQRRGKRLQSDAILLPHTLNCPECGLHIQIPALKQGSRAICPRCRHELVRVENNPYHMPPALAATTLILLLCVYSNMFITVSLAGINETLSMPSMVKGLIQYDFGFLAEVMFLFTFGSPLIFLILCLYVYIAIIARKPLPFLLNTTRTMLRLREWIMIDVFFISTLVAYIKLSAMARVEFGAAFWLMAVMALILVRTIQSVPQHWVYSQIRQLCPDPAPSNEPTICCSRCLHYSPAAESQCRICGSHLFERRPKSLQYSAAFLIAAAILYLPANILPIMISSNPLNTEINTIMNGIAYMWNDGDKVIASIIFSASIMVPTLKILSLAFLQFSARYGLPMSVEKISLLYRITETVGRWSMIDIFVIIILMSAFHTPVARVTPGPAAVYFCCVVLLTMLSAHYFDPRLLWDKKLRNTED